MMRLNPCVIVFVFYSAACRCGVIDEVLLARRQDRGKRAAAAEGAVNYDGRTEVADSGVPGNHPLVDNPNSVGESLKLPSVKQKRCPSLQQRLGSSHDSSSEHIVSAMIPLDIQRRDLQSDMRKRLCKTCMARPQCKNNNKCDQCKRWCIEEDTSPNDITDESMQETKNLPHSNTNEIESNDFPISLPNRFGGASVEDRSIEDTRVSLPAPGGVKRIFTIANFSSGPLKELICRLLGIADTTDIDKMVVWVTTFSNEPPKFAEGYKKNVSPLVEKMTDVLNDELKKSMERNKKQGRNFLTNAEMEEIAKNVLASHPAESTRPGAARSSFSEDFQDRNSFSTARRVNPDLIEGTFDPQLLEGSNEEFPTAPRIGSTIEESETTPEEETVGISGAKTEDTARQMQSTSDQNPNLPSLGDTKDETQSTADKKEPSRFITKKLMQQVKDRMKQRLKYPEQLHSDTLTGKPQDSILGKEDQSQATDSENIDPSLQSPQTSEDPRVNTIDSITAETGPNGGGDETSMDKTEPNKFATKNLMEQVRDKIKQKLKYPEQFHSDTLIGRNKPQDPTLGRTEDVQASSKMTDSSLRLQQISEADPHANTIDSAITATAPNIEDPDETQPSVDNKEPSRFVTKNLLQQIRDRMKQRLKYPEQSDTFIDKSKPQDSPLGRTKDVQANSKIIETPADIDSSLQSQQTSEADPQANTIDSAVAATGPDREDPDETQSTMDKKEPSMFVTKKLMQQVKDRMIQRLKYPEQHPSNTLLGSRIQEISEDSGTNTIDSTIAETGPNVEGDVVEEQQGIQLRKGDSVLVGSSGIEDDRLGSDGTKSGPTGISAYFNKLKDASSEILRNLKVGAPNTQKIDNFDTAKAVLKNVANIVDEIEKETDVNPDTEQTNLSALGIDNENLLTPSENLERTSNIAQQHPTDLVGITPEKEIKQQPQIITEKFPKTRLFGKGSFGQPKSQTAESSNDRLGSQPLEHVIWDKDMHPRKFQDINQRRNKDRLRLGTPNAAISSTGAETPVKGLMNDIPAQFPTQKLTVHGKEVPMKQKMKVEISPHSGIDRMIGAVSKYNDGISELTNNESLGAMEGSQDTAGDVDNETIDNIPEQIDNRFRNIPPNFQQSGGGVDFDNTDIIPEAMDSRFKNIEDPNSNIALESVGSPLKEPLGSNSLGTLIPFKKGQASTPLFPKDIYFIGNGIKLPLHMVHNDDGAVHLSVDLDRLCSCKNNTVCPKNHTENILGNQATMENLLGSSKPKQRLMENQEANSETGFGNILVGASLPQFQQETKMNSNRIGRKTESKWLDMKNSIASQLDPYQEYTQRDANIFKRSTEKTTVKETSPEKITMPITEAKDSENGDGGNSISKNSSLEYPDDDVQDTLDTFQQFLNNKLTNLKSKMKNIERTTELKSQQSGEKLMNALNAVNKNTQHATNEYINTEKSSYELEEALHASKSFVPSKPFELKSRFREDLSKEQRENELFDILTPIKGVYKFKKVEDLQNKLEKINEYVDQYTKENENLLKKEADVLVKTQKNSFIKKEVDIVNSVLNFLRKLATDNK